MKGILKFDGKDFISAKDAAKMVGYVPDYVGQLARSAKVEAKMIGRAWFVSRESILKHRDLNASVSGASRIVDFLAGVEKKSQSAHTTSSVPARTGSQNAFESELAYGSESTPLTPAFDKKIISSVANGARRSLVPLLSKASSLVTTELLQKAAALAVSSAFVFGAYAGVERGGFERVAFFAASAARTVSEISLNDTRAAIAEFAARVPLYAAAGAQEFAGRALSMSGIIKDVSRVAYAGIISFARAPFERAQSAEHGMSESGAALADVAPAARGFTQEIAKAFFRGVNLLAVDTGRTLLSLFGAPVPGTGLAVTPSSALPPAPTAPQSEPSPAPRSLVAAAERVTTPERVVERVIIGEISREELNEKLSILNNKLSSEIYKISAQGGRNATNITNVYQAVANTNKIDKLRTVDIFEPTISGGSISGMGSIGATSANFTTLTGTTVNVTGALSVTATSTLNSGLVVDTNTLFVDASTNRVGIGTTSPSATFAVQGDVYISGTLTAITSVVATSTITAQNFVASSGTATSTFAGGLTIETDGFVYDWASNRVGVGTSSPYATLSVASPSGSTPAFLISTSTATATSTAFLIDSNGKVGIASTAPSATLSVNGNFYLTGTGGATSTVIGGYLDVQGTQNSQTGVATSSFAGGLKTGTILVTGNGAATSSYFGSPIDVWGTLATSSFSGGVRSLSFLAQNGLTLDGGNLFHRSANFVVQSGGNVGIGTTSPTQLLSVSSSGGNSAYFAGNVGVGTNAPGVLLDVSGQSLAGNGTMRITNTNTGTREALVLRRASGTGGTSFILDDTAGTNGRKFEFFATDDGNSEGAGKLIIFNNAVANVTVDSGGNIGIGTTTPGTLLSVQGVGNFNTGTSTLYASLALPTISATSTTASSTIQTLDTKGISSTNGFTLTGGSLTNTSTATSTWSGGLSATGLASSQGLTITGGTISTASTALTIQPGASSNTLLNPVGGNVGIGTTSPWGLLSVEQGSTGPVFVVSDQGTSSPSFIVAGSGNVGIGTAGPSDLTHLYGAPASSISSTYKTLLRIQNSAASASGNQAGINFSTNNGGSGNAFIIAQEGASAAGSLLFGGWNGSAHVESMRIVNSSGNVGIGTTGPGAKLDVLDSDIAMIIGADAAAATLRTNATTKNGIIAGYHYTNAEEPVNIIGYSADSTTNTLLIGGGNSFMNAATAINFYTAANNTTVTGTQRMVIDSGGNVGIGTTTPNDVLEVVGGNIRMGASPGDPMYQSGRLTAFDSTKAVVGTLGFGLSHGAASLGDMILRLSYATTTTNKLFIENASGQGGGSGVYLTAGATAWTANSDERLKTNIVPLSTASGLAAIRELTPITFNWRDVKQDNSQGSQIGFTAQNVEQVFPGLISRGATVKVTLSDGSTETVTDVLGLNSTGLIPPMVKAIQEIAERIDLGSAPTSTPSIYIDAAGNIGIGTSTPGYKMEVMGDVAATSFINISTRDAKKDIAYVSDDDKRSISEKIRNIKVAEYRYSGENGAAPLRLGLIAEEAPPEVLSANKKGVDVYKLATFILAGVQEQQKRIDAMELRLTRLEQLVASSTPASTGFSLSDMLAGLKNLVVESLTASKKLCVDDVCVDKEQFKQLLAGAGITPTSSTSGVSSSTPDVFPSADTEAPVITVNGNNPAEIAVGSAYADLGASVTDNVDTNLGIKASLDNTNWIEIGNISLDTASSTSYTIHYRATDNAGNIGTAERTVVVGSAVLSTPTEPPAPVPEPEATTTPQS